MSELVVHWDMACNNERQEHIIRNMLNMNLKN